MIPAKKIDGVVMNSSQPLDLSFEVREPFGYDKNSIVLTTRIVWNLYSEGSDVSGSYRYLRDIKRESGSFLKFKTSRY